MPISKIVGRATDNLFTNVSDAGTEGTKIALGTTAQRGTTVGQLRYNTDLARFEATGAGPQYIGFATPPTITSISPTTLDAAGGETVVITGTNFVIGSTTVTFDGTAPSSTTINSATQITVVTPAKSAATYTNGLVVTASGASATFTFTTSGTPAFTTSAGSLGIFNEGTSVGTLVGGTDVGTAHAVTTGALPSGVSIASANGNITGTLPANTNTNTIPENATGDVTTTFTITATDAESQTSTRQFTIGNKQGDPFFSKTYFANSDNSNTTTNEGGASDKGAITNNNSSTVTSGTTTKKFGSRALSFQPTGSDENSNLDIAVPSDKAFNESGSDYMTFDGWGYLETNQNNETWGSGQSYGNQGFIGVDNTYMSVTIDSTGRVGFYQYDSGGSPQYRGQWPTTGNISTGVWFHFVFQFENNQVRYWKDGTYIGTVVRGTQNSGTPHSYRIGGTLSGGQGNRHWKGYFDELRLTISGNSSDARLSGSGSYTVPTEGLRLFTT
tara:strand:+ start:31 stop:1530 length:1500 start_codon:yes stop_codon:yes gene_type:complete